MATNGPSSMNARVRKGSFGERRQTVAVRMLSKSCHRLQADNTDFAASLDDHLRYKSGDNSLSVRWLCAPQRLTLSSRGYFAPNYRSQL